VDVETIVGTVETVTIAIGVGRPRQPHAVDTSSQAKGHPWQVDEPELGVAMVVVVCFGGDRRFKSRFLTGAAQEVYVEVETEVDCEITTGAVEVMVPEVVVEMIVDVIVDTAVLV